jgi:DNA repair and recombination protein RAD54B
MDQVEQAKPRSRVDSLLSSVDLENIVALDEKQPLLSVRDVPGGTVSFLFEKISTTSLGGVGDKAGQTA